MFEVVITLVHVVPGMRIFSFGFSFFLGGGAVVEGAVRWGCCWVNGVGKRVGGMEEGGKEVKGGGKEGAMPVGRGRV